MTEADCTLSSRHSSDSRMVEENGISQCQQCYREVKGVHETCTKGSTAQQEGHVLPMANNWSYLCDVDRVGTQEQ